MEVEEIIPFPVWKIEFPVWKIELPVLKINFEPLCKKSERNKSMF